MPRRKGSSPTSGGAATTPLKGMRADGNETEQTLALEMLVRQMEGFERQIRLQNTAIEKLLQARAGDADRIQQQVQQQIAKDKADSAAAIQEVRDKLQELLEAKRPDEHTQQVMVEDALVKARQEIADSHTRFQEELSKMKRGTLTSNESESVLLTINGVRHLIKPGRNTKVPEAFIKAWKRRVEEKKWAKQLDLSFQGNNPADRIQRLRGLPSMWNENSGGV